jgi:translation initiation factor 1A
MTKQTKTGKNKNKNYQKTKEIQFKESEDQIYGKVSKMLGNNRLEVECFDGIKRLGHIRGSLRVRIETADIILLSLRDFQDSKCDVIFKYSPEEVRILRSQNQIPPETKANLVEETIEEDVGGFTFEDI